MRVKVNRPAFSKEQAEILFPGALGSFPGGDLKGYDHVGWSFPSFSSAVPDGISVIPADPNKTGYLFFNGKWRKL